MTDKEFKAQHLKHSGRWLGFGFKCKLSRGMVKKLKKSIIKPMFVPIHEVSGAPLPQSVRGEQKEFVSTMIRSGEADLAKNHRL